MKLTALTIQLDSVYWVVSLHQMCKTLLLQMPHIKSFSAENVSFFLLFCVVSFFLFVKITTRSFKCLPKRYSQLSVTVKFSSSLIDAIQFLNRILEFSSQTINKKKSRSGRRLREHWYYVNVAYKMHISVYQAYIQDVARETIQPLKILDHQISYSGST